MQTQFSHSKARTSLLFMVLFILFAGFVGVLILMNRGTDSRSQAANEAEYYFKFDPIGQVGPTSVPAASPEERMPIDLLHRPTAQGAPAGAPRASFPPGMIGNNPGNGMQQYALNFYGSNGKTTALVTQFAFAFSMPRAFTPEQVPSQRVPSPVPPTMVTRCFPVTVRLDNGQPSTVTQCRQVPTAPPQPDTAGGGAPGMIPMDPNAPPLLTVSFIKSPVFQGNFVRTDNSSARVVEVRSGQKLLMTITQDPLSQLEMTDASVNQLTGEVMVKGITRDPQTNKQTKIAIAGQKKVGDVKVFVTVDNRLVGFLPTVTASYAYGYLPGAPGSLVNLTNMGVSPTAKPIGASPVLSPIPSAIQSQVNGACTTNSQCTSGSVCFTGYCVVATSVTARPVACAQVPYFGRMPVTDSSYPRGSTVQSVFQQLGASCVNNVEVDSTQKPFYLYNTCGVGGAAPTPQMMAQRNYADQQTLASAKQQGFRVVNFCNQMAMMAP